MLNILIILHDRVCFNYHVAVSASNPELWSKNVSSYTPADGSVATSADKLRFLVIINIIPANPALHINLYIL